MTLIEEVELRLNRIPSEKQNEVLDFITFLKERVSPAAPVSTGAERGKRIKSAMDVAWMTA